MTTRKIVADNPPRDLPEPDTADNAALARMEKIWQRQELARTWPSGRQDGSGPAPSVEPPLLPPGEAEIDPEEIREKVYNDGDIFRGRPGRMPTP